MFYVKVKADRADSLKNVVSACPFEDDKSSFYEVLSGNKNRDAIFAFSTRSVWDEILVGRMAKAFGGYHAQTLMALATLKKYQ